MGDANVIRDHVCTACGCTCDDLALTLDGERIAAVSPPCPLAERFFLAERAPPDPVGDIGALVAQAAALLRAARAPLVMGFERATVEAQRLAVEIADRVGAFIDPTDERGASRSHAAVQTVGAVTATLGEVASRSDLVVYWECDPATTHPRHMERFASRPGQRTIVVDSWPSPSAAMADEYRLIPADGGLESLWALRAAVRGMALDPEIIESQTGNTLASWQQLAAEIQAAHYPTIFFSSASGNSASTSQSAKQDDAAAQAITELVGDLHRHSRAVALPLGNPPNAVGAQQVLTWQTGFPAAVSFARGYPEFLPGEATATRLLERSEVDAALVIAADPLSCFSPKATAQLRTIPTIVLDDRETATLAAATVAIRTATFGIHTTGTVFRSGDGVALPLHAALDSPLPDAADVLARISLAVRD